MRAVINRMSYYFIKVFFMLLLFLVILPSVSYAQLKSGAEDGSILNGIGNDAAWLNMTDAINLSNNPNDSVYGQVAANGNYVYVVWQDSVSSGNSNSAEYDIFYKKSSDGGITFEDAINVSNNSGFSEHPQIALYGEKVHVVWIDNVNGNKEIMYKSSMDHGVTFGDTKVLSEADGGSHNAELAVYNNNLYIVWEGTGPENKGIFVRTSNDAGQTFGHVIKLGSNTNESFPKVAASDNDVYVVWNFNDPKGGLFFTKSADGGRLFSDPVRINYNFIYGESQITANKKDVYIIWSGSESGGPVYFTKSNDRGTSFSYPKLISQKDFKEPKNVEITNYGNILYIAQQASYSGNEEIALKISYDGGMTFGQTVNVSNNSGFSECPSIAISGDSMYIVWEDFDNGSHEILLKRTDI